MERKGHNSETTSPTEKVRVLLCFMHIPHIKFNFKILSLTVLCRMQSVTDRQTDAGTLDTYLSLSFHSDTLPEYLPYPTSRRKNTPPYNEYLPLLLHPRHLSVHTCTNSSQIHTPICISLPILHVYCQGLIKYKAETIYQIRPK